MQNLGHYCVLKHRELPCFIYISGSSGRNLISFLNGFSARTNHLIYAPFRGHLAFQQMSLWKPTSQLNSSKIPMKKGSVVYDEIHFVWKIKEKASVPPVRLEIAEK